MWKNDVFSGNQYCIQIEDLRMQLLHIITDNLIQEHSFLNKPKPLNVFILVPLNELQVEPSPPHTPQRSGTSPDSSWRSQPTFYKKKIVVKLAKIMRPPFDFQFVWHSKCIGKGAGIYGSHVNSRRAIPINIIDRYRIQIPTSNYMMIGSWRRPNCIPECNSLEWTDID